MSASGYAVKHKERQAERVSSAARPGRRPAAVGLSAVLAQQPGSFDGKKIAAVDKSIASLDALPERYAAVKTLYVSKNSLRSLAGVEQFRGLRALSAADNELGDLECLRALPAAGIALEAASFEGNPMADLPNYRAHAIATLGPSLAMLDNRPVGEEERRAAPGAVAHEATMLALMTSNACLVHKLGRAVQLVKLHCELQCAVLGGQYGSAAAAGAGAGPESLPGSSGRGMSRLLQLWDAEGSLGRQERHAIGLAIRREVGRRYRKLVLAGGKPEGSSKLWQQAFAQVMLLQQETIASLMGMLEDAKSEAAATLAPITRPPSPTKRAALQGEQQAQARVRQDREALIQDLRDAFLGLADAAAHSNAPQRAARYEARIRELHAALEAASGTGSSTVPQQRQALEAQDGEEAAAAGRGQWAIAAMRPASAGPAPAAAAVPQGQLGAARLKSALKAQRGDTHGPEPAPRPASARPGGSGAPASGELAGEPRPGTAPASRQPGAPAGLRQWHADDGLAEYERMEQARCTTPRPFQGASQAPASSGHAVVAREGSRHPAPRQPPVAAASRSSSPQRARPASPGHPLPGSPSAQWVPNPLACSSNEGDACPRAESPQDGAGLHAILRLLQREGRVSQMEALQSIMAQHETAAAELQAANHQLALALQEAQQHTRSLEGQLADQRAALEEAAGVAAAQERRREQQLEELGSRLEEVLANRAALRADLQAAAAERQQLAEQAQAERQRLAGEAQREREAAAATSRQLAARVAELEGRKAVELRLTVVSHEAEWRAEAARVVALEARAGELQGQVAAYQQQERVEAASSALASRVMLRRVLMRWREAAAECAYLAAMQQAAALLRRRTLLAGWLAAWRLAARRSQLVAAREQQRQLRRVQGAWQAWQAYCQGCVLGRGLDAAAGMQRQSALLRQCFAAWLRRTAACRQVELPARHPAVRAGAQLQRHRLLRSFFGSWRGHMREHVLPRLAAVQVRLLERWMGSQRRALLAWQDYLQHRRHTRLLKALAGRHFLQRQLSCWRQAASKAKRERTAALRGALTSRALLLRRGWRAWRLGVAQQRHQAQQLAQVQHRRRLATLAACWEGWQEWTAVCRGMNRRRDARLLAAALQAWRRAAQWAEKRRMAAAFSQRCSQRRFRASLRAWRAAVAARRQRTHQLGHARGLLRRRLLGRLVAGWRRAALAGKLCATLGVVAQLQAAVQDVSRELQSKAGEVEALECVRVEVEGQAECLHLQVESLDGDLATAQRQVAELQAAAHLAQEQHRDTAQALERALAAQAAAEAAGAAAAAQRDAAEAGREAAEAERAAACAARDAADRAAQDACAKAEAAAASAATAVAQAAAASAALDALVGEHQQAQEQLRQAQQERQALAADLAQALEEVQRTAGLLAGLQEECGRLRRAREQAEASCAEAAAEQAAALRQAERLAALCEEQEQRGGQLQQQVAHLQGMLGSQGALQEELAALGDRNRQLCADNESMRAQLERFAAAVQQGEEEHGRLEQAAGELRREGQRLQERAQEAEAEARQLAKLADSLQGAKTSLEGQLAEAQGEASAAAAARQAATAAADALRQERDGLAATVQQLQEGNVGLESAVARLRGQLQQSNGVLDSCRQMLGECCSARAAADDQAVSLSELLRSVKADQLLKEAAIKALTRENAQRGERLRALHAQVEALSQQVLGGSQAGAHSHSQPPPPPQPPPYGRLAPAAAPAASPGSSWASAGPGPRATPAPGSGNASAAAGAGGASPGGSSVHQQPRKQEAPAFAFPAASGSPAASYIPLSAHQQTSPRSGSGGASPGPAGSAGSSARGGGAGPPSSATLAQLLPPRALSPGGYGPGEPPPSLAPELSDQRLSYLLEMVVQKRITATLAQQVINAAAEGDARPLLHVLDSARRRVEGQSLPAAAGPVAEEELSAARQQIQQHLCQQQPHSSPSGWP